MNQQSETKVAIVLPVYNTEKYLIECLDSILNQDHSNFMIFAINDGSTDGSPKILEQYSKIDSRIKVIHQLNRGLSASRNRALDIIEKDSSFSFVSFIDSDDVVQSNFLSSHVNALKETFSDVSICGFEKLYNNGRTRQQHPLPAKQILNTEDFIDLIFSFGNWQHACGAGGMVWKHMYKSSAIRGIRFPINDKLLEDEPFNVLVAQKAEKYIFIPDTPYRYRQIDNSLCKAKNFRHRRLNGRQFCIDHCQDLSKKSQLVIFSAFLDSLISLLKEQQLVTNLELYQSKATLAKQEGILRKKTYNLFNLFCNHPNLAKIYVLIRKASKPIRSHIGLRV